MINVHYSLETGDIAAFGNDGFECCSNSFLDGHRVRTFGEVDAVDPKTQRVDLSTLNLVSKEPEAAPDRIGDVRRVVAAELAASDKFMLPDYPISGADRAAWIGYRQALRDASKGNTTAAAMLAAIPARPDGSQLTINLQDLG